MSVAAQSQRDVANRAQVRRDALADRPVAARRRPRRARLAVRQADRRAVDLELAVVAGAAHVVAGQAHDALLPRRQLLLVERVASDSIGTRCVCLASWLAGSAPTRCVGESGVRSVGVLPPRAPAARGTAGRTPRRRSSAGRGRGTRTTRARSSRAQLVGARGQLGEVGGVVRSLSLGLFIDHLHRDRHEPLELLVRRLRQQRLGPH